MSTGSLMTMADLLCYIREQIIQAREENNNKVLQELFTTLGIIQDAIENSPDKTYWWIVDNLYNAIRHSGYAEHKVTIPSIDDIRLAGH